MSSRHRWIIAGVALVVLSFASFLAGRYRANHRVQNLSARPSERRITNPPIVSATIGSGEIAYVGSWSFKQAYPVIRAASPAQREAWAKELEQMPDGAQKLAARGVFYKSLVQTDPKQAVALAMNLRSELDRIRVTGFMMVVTPYRAMDELVRLMSTFPRKDLSLGGSDEFNNTIEAWSAVDPVAVAKFLEANPKENVQAHRVSLVRYWAAYDPAAANAWLERTQTQAQESDETGAPSAINKALVEGWFENNRTEAIKFALANQENENLRSAIGSLTQTLLRESPDAARNFVDSLDKNAKYAALLDCLDAMERSPEAYERMGRRHETEDIQRAPNRPPEFVADWLLKFPSEDRGPMVTILSTWDSEQPERYVNWVAQLPTATRSELFKEYTVGRGEEQIAAVLALPDVHVRDEILDAIASKVSPYDAEEFLKNPKFSEAQRAHLASLIPRKTEEE